MHYLVMLLNQLFLTCSAVSSHADDDIQGRTPTNTATRDPMPLVMSPSDHSQNRLQPRGNGYLCCVMDDALQGVTDVVRGKDLYQATSVHVVLQSLLDYVSPRYVHHDLILDDAGKKLSKSINSKSIRALRKAGISKEAVWNTLGF